MPEEIHTALQSFLPRLPASGRYTPPSSYAPPAYLPMHTMRELRLNHRTWLPPSALGHAAEARPVPPSFAPSPPSSDALVLAPIDPMTHARRVPLSSSGGGGGGGGGGSRPTQLGVERHPASRSVVAMKMRQV